MKKTIRLSCYFLLCIATSVHALDVTTQIIVTDGTMGKTVSLTPTSGTIEIKQELGKTVGTNLFHSFRSFGINTDETVAFLGDAALTNVISRVTGGQESLINGTLRSIGIPNANFYFINPAGVTFGVKATIDVPGAFHVSTANALRFSDGNQFTASIDPNASQLTISDPSSFGFLESSDASLSKITVNGSKLSVTEGKTFDLVTNNITIQNTAQLSAPAGKIRLVAFKGTGDVSPDLDNSTNTTLPTANNSGNIILDNSDLVADGNDNGGGYIALWGGNIDIKNNSAVKANTRGAFAGSVIIKSDTLKVSNGAAIRTTTFAKGDAGNITVTSNNVNIDGESNSRLRFTGITSGAESGGGHGGMITINVSNALNIKNFSGIRSNTFLDGNAGVVSVSAKLLKIDGYGVLDRTGIPRFTGIASRAEAGSSGAAGKVSVNADKLEIVDLGQISSSTLSTGNAGTVTVTANTINLDGNNYPINSKNPTGITAQATNSGHAGSVEVTATESLMIANGAQITSNSSAADSNAGIIIVTSPKITLNNNAYITTSAKTGNGGDITLNADKLINLKNSGVITSVDKASGRGGDINVYAHALVMNNAVIQANADGGSGGDINLKLKSLISSQDHLIKGGAKIDWLPYQEGLNVIQAASQRGVSGSINVTSPKFNISGSLTGLDSDTELPILNNNPCQSSAALASSLARSGKGGLPATEARAVFVPTISQQTNNDLQSNASLSEKMPAVSSAFALNKTYPCATVSTNGATGIK